MFNNKLNLLYNNKLKLKLISNGAYGQIFKDDKKKTKRRLKKDWENWEKIEKIKTRKVIEL